MNREEQLNELCVLALERGAVGFGVCRLDSIDTAGFLLPKDVSSLFPRAISVALRVASEVLSTVEEHPNPLYEHHYRQVNFALDRLALDTANWVHKLGGKALPVPASQLVDWENQRGHLSHKRIAVAAGLGWLGRNNLLVTHDYGAQVRLVTILTDLNLPVKGHDRTAGQSGSCPEPGCGSCRACVAVCPANAIKETQAEFDHHACFAMLKEFQRRRYVSQYICGLCVRACSGPR